jgi:AcrR family transcriptional regulator
MDQMLEATRRLNAQAAPATDRGGTTRRQILETAANYFAQKGYAGTSVNDVIREAGVTKGGFYFHFPSKEALALAVLRHKQEQWAGRVVAATMRHTAAVDQLRAMVDALTDLHEQDPSARSIGRLCLELAENRDLVPALAPQFSTWVDLTASLFAKAQQEGTFRDDLDPRAAGESAVAAYIGLEMMSNVDGAPLRPRVERLFHLFYDAFSPSQT